MNRQTYEAANEYCQTIYARKDQVYQCLNDFTKGAQFMHNLHTDKSENPSIAPYDSFVAKFY